MIEDNNKGFDQEINELQRVQGISLKDGLEYCGSYQALLKFLGTFYNSIDSKSQEIEDAFNRNDIEFYAIKVHALKSTSRIIGAGELFELALSLEEAGHANNLEYINANTQKLLDLHRSYKEKLSAVADDKASAQKPKKPISFDELNDAYMALKEVVPQMDYDSVEIILDELHKYSLPAGAQEQVDKMTMLFRNLDWKKMEELLAE